MASKAKGRKKAISDAQKEALVSYLELNLWVARNQFSSSDGTGDRNEQWRNIANTLNALGGACKTSDEWKKCWSDQRNAIRKKYMAEKARMAKSGINGEVADRLDAYEQRVVAILTKEAIEGDGTREHGLPISSAATTAACPNEVDSEEDEVVLEVESETPETPETLNHQRTIAPEPSCSRDPGPITSGNRQTQRPVPREPRAPFSPNDPGPSNPRNNQLQRPTHGRKRQSRARQTAQRSADDETEMFRTLLDLKKRKLDVFEETNNREKEERQMKQEEHLMRMNLMQAKLNALNKKN